MLRICFLKYKTIYNPDWIFDHKYYLFVRGHCNISVSQTQSNFFEMSKTPDRNDPCHCGSGKKYKNCHMKKDQSGTSSKIGLIGIVVALILGIVLVGLALSGGEGGQDCPPGTSWSADHGHCH